MKKRVIFLLSAFLIFSMPLPVDALVSNPFSPDLTTIQGMSHTWDADDTTSSGLTVTPEDSTVRFSAEMQFLDGDDVDGWAAMGIGYGWAPPNPLDDLTTYDGYSLMFKNTNNSSWWVNVYMNTGWTDAPYNEDDNFYQNGWTELLPGVSTMVTLDFAAEGVINLDHVTNIGFEVGGNLEDYPFSDPMNPSNPDSYHIDVWQVPEPATMCLLSMGALILLRKRRA
jgi:hypothetical protein